MKQRIKKLLRPIVYRVQSSWLAKPLYYALDALFVLRYALLGRPRIPEEDIRNVEENVAFIYKSFNRQRLAKRLYRSIKRCYPLARIIIADDSSVP